MRLFRRGEFLAVDVQFDVRPSLAERRDTVGGSVLLFGPIIAT
jgi:hypothetical protein